MKLRKRLFYMLPAVALMMSLAACSLAVPTETAGAAVPTETTGVDVPTTVTTAPTETTQQVETQPVPIKTAWFWTEKKLSNTKGSGSVYTRTYDEKGNLLTDTFASNDGRAGHSNTYTYDAAGRVLTHDAQDAYSTSHTEFTYDAAGRVATETFSDNQGNIGNMTYTYREDGLLAEKVLHQGKAESRYGYTYDEKGNLLKEEHSVVKDGKAVVQSFVEWTYDDNGNKLSETDSGGFRSDWTYDDKGKVLSCTDLDSEGNIIRGFLYEYDDQNRVLLEYPFENDPKNPTGKYIYEYDEAGRVTTKYTCTPNSSRKNASSFCRYTYDENGNLLSEITTKKDGTELSRIEYTYIAIEVPIN